MSILINMEMPTDHPLWIIVHSDGTVEANEVSASRPVGWQTLRNAAVPVPPHGRLVDADAIRAGIDEKRPGRSYEDAWALTIMDAAPTVLEAEEV